MTCLAEHLVSQISSNIWNWPNKCSFSWMGTHSLRHPPKSLLRRAEVIIAIREQGGQWDSVIDQIWPCSHLRSMMSPSFQWDIVDLIWPCLVNGIVLLNTLWARSSHPISVPDLKMFFWLDGQKFSQTPSKIVSMKTGGGYRHKGAVGQCNWPNMAMWPY